MAAIDPEMTDANSSAAAAQAPNPISMICNTSSCPASSAVRDGSQSVTTKGANSEWQVANREGRLVLLFAIRYLLFAIRCLRLSDHVGQQSKEPRALDRLRQLTLLLGGNR